jgi:hypothetical protein
MSENEKLEAGQETMDRLLHRAMGASPPPQLSPGFDRRLARRLAPRRLSPSGRRVLASYSVAALAASVWVMRSASIGWPLVATAILVPLLILAMVYHRRLRPVS